MIIPSAKYPTQTDVDLTHYPQGKARNVTASGDHTGTPLEKDWLNDWFGFQQAAVLAGGVTPSGSPDTATASDVLNAVIAKAVSTIATSILTFSGVGRMLLKTQACTDSDSTYSPVNGNVLIAPVLTANRAYTISGGVDGDWIIAVNTTDGFTLSVNGYTPFQGLAGGFNRPGWSMLIHFGGLWREMMHFSQH